MRTINMETLCGWTNTLAHRGTPPPLEPRSFIEQNECLRLELGVLTSANGHRLALNAIFAQEPKGFSTLIKTLGPEATRVDNGARFRSATQTLLLFREDDHMVLEFSEELVLEGSGELIDVARNIDCLAFARPLWQRLDTLQRIVVGRDSDLGVLALVKSRGDGVEFETIAPKCGLAKVGEGRFENATGNNRVIVFGGTLYTAVGPSSLTRGAFPSQPQTRWGKIERELDSLVGALRSTLREDERKDVQECIVQGDLEAALSLLDEVVPPTGPQRNRLSALQQRMEEA